MRMRHKETTAPQRQRARPKNPHARLRYGVLRQANVVHRVRRNCLCANDGRREQEQSGKNADFHESLRVHSRRVLQAHCHNCCGLPGAIKEVSGESSCVGPSMEFRSEKQFAFDIFFGHEAVARRLSSACRPLRSTPGRWALCRFPVAMDITHRLREAPRTTPTNARSLRCFRVLERTISGRFRLPCDCTSTAQDEAPTTCASENPSSACLVMRDAFLLGLPGRLVSFERLAPAYYPLDNVSGLS